MAGFFKKLFNRIGGPAETAPPPAEEIVSVEPAAEPAAEVPERDPDAPADWILRELLAHEEAPPAEPAVTEPAPVPDVPPAAAEAVTPAAAPDIPQPPVAPPVTPSAAQAEAEEHTSEAKAKPPKPPAKVKAEPKKPAVRKPAAKPEAAPKPSRTRVKEEPKPHKAPPVTPAPPAPAPEKPAPKAAPPAPITEKPVPKVVPPAPAPEKPAPKVAAPAPALEKPAPKVAPPAPRPPEVLPPAADIPPAPVRVIPPEPEPQPLPLPVEPPPPPAPVQSPPPRTGRLVKPAEPPVAAAPEPERKGWLGRLREGLSKSSRNISTSLTSIFTKKKLDAATLQDLEDVLLQADLGLPMAERIVKAVSAGRFDREIDPEEVKRILADEVAKVLRPVEVPFNFGSEKPFVILVVGVNGSGKTTTIGKLGAIAAGEGFKVMFAACDTFRAAAIEQLQVWGKRIGVKVVSRPTGADASGLAFDAMKEAREDGTEILFIDTAGRLQNKAYLMDELDKVVRVIKKQDASAPHAVLLVLDATTGQNAMAQADVFTKVAGVTGLIMTKLDGTARGGILVAIAEKFKLPVHAIGVGEQIDDLQPFDATAFARTIAGLEVT